VRCYTPAAPLCSGSQRFPPVCGSSRTPPAGCLCTSPLRSGLPAGGREAAPKMRARMAALQIACSAELSNTSHDNQGDNAQQHGSSSAGWALTRATVQSACRLQPEPCGAQQGSCRRRCARQRAAVRQRRSASSASRLLVHSAATPAPCAANVRTHPGSAWVSPLCSSCTASLLLARLLALPRQFSGLVARYLAQTRPPTHVLTDTGFSAYTSCSRVAPHLGRRRRVRPRHARRRPLDPPHDRRVRACHARG